MAAASRKRRNSRNKYTLSYRNVYIPIYVIGVDTGCGGGGGERRGGLSQKLTRAFRGNERKCIAVAQLKKKIAQETREISVCFARVRIIEINRHARYYPTGTAIRLFVTARINDPPIITRDLRIVKENIFPSARDRAAIFSRSANETSKRANALTRYMT